MSKTLPTYTDEKRKGNIGEALVQYLLSDFCLVHKIDGSNDVGNDFVCELIRDKSPTNLLFYVQVKYTKSRPRIKSETLEYWKGSPIPVYLFWVKDVPSAIGSGLPMINFEDIEKKYKRYTPILHNEIKHKNEGFKTFNKYEFLRDLVIDYARTQYKKGFTPVIRPRDFLTLEDKMEIGFPQFQLLIDDVIPEYTNEITKGGWANLFSLAVILNESDDRDDKVSALSLFKISKKLLDKDRDFVDTWRFHEQLEIYINDLSQELGNQIQ